MRVLISGWVVSRLSVILRESLCSRLSYRWHTAVLVIGGAASLVEWIGANTGIVVCDTVRIVLWEVSRVRWGGGCCSS